MYMQSPDGKVVKVVKGKNLEEGLAAQGWTRCDPPKKRTGYYINETTFDRR